MMYRSDLVNPPRIRPTEYQTVFHIPAHGIDQRFRNTVRNFLRTAFFQTVVTFTDWQLCALYTVDKLMRNARPGIPTGLWIISIFSSLA